jgi:hypothetical protein
MKEQSKNTLRRFSLIVSLAAAVMMASPVANAALVDITPTTSPISAGGASIFYSPSPALAIKYADVANADIGSQSPANVGSAIQAAFGTVALINVSFADPGSTFNASATGFGATTGSTYTSTLNYRYLAVHYDNHELLFDFGPAGITGGTAFTIGSDANPLPNGVSNFRAYAPVPVPAAIWLLGSSVLGLIGMSRRKTV